MIDLGKQNVLGIGINAVDYDAATEYIACAAVDKRPFAVSALAVHGVMTGALDVIHRQRLNKLDMVVPDGQPVRWAIKWLHGVSLPDRVYGPELTLRVCERAAREGLSIYLYGSRSEVIDKLTINLRRRFPDLLIAGSQPSKFRQVTAEEQAEIAEAIKASGAAIVLVGLGCPRQETWVFEYRDHAGIISQAPAWLQKRGLEWLYRLVKEPARLWKRYAVTNSLYILYVALQYTRLRRMDLEEVALPVPRMRFG
jgi:N-acetylglucosaminyldiphosphoundecaprenol N-acetyl-beta-D-mannosaminyltransferase